MDDANRVNLTKEYIYIYTESKKYIHTYINKRGHSKNIVNIKKTISVKEIRIKKH